MQEIIDEIAAQVGITPDLAHKATSQIVDFIVTQAPPQYIDAIRPYVPGLDELAATGAAHAQAAAAETSGGGLMGALGGLMGGGGGLMGALGGLMGGSEGGGIGAAMALLGNLDKDGLDMGQVQQIASTLIERLRQMAGNEAVDGLVAQIPGASRFLA